MNLLKGCFALFYSHAILFDFVNDQYLYHYTLLILGQIFLYEGQILYLFFY